MTLVVADSSYIVEGLLKDSSLFDGHIVCAPDYSLYEVLNVIWKHQMLLKKIRDGRIIVDALFDLILSEHIQFIALREKMVRNAYDLAVKTKMPVYDITFVVLATELGVELKTFDKQQYTTFKKFTSR